MKVAQVMTNRPLTVREDDLATKVRSLFRKSDFRSIPVVDREQRLLGIITRKDILGVTSTKSNIQAEGLMSIPILTLTPEEDILTAMRRMAEASISTVMVVESNNSMRLVGLVTVQDIMNVIIEKGFTPKKKIIEEIMTRDVVTCTPEDHLPKVWTRMEETGYSGIPVLKKKKLIGIITRKDILNSGFARIHREDEKGKGKFNTPVEKVMRTPVITIKPEDKVEDAVRIMYENNIGRIPVVANGRLVGIVDRGDIMLQYADN